MSGSYHVYNNGLGYPGKYVRKLLFERDGDKCFACGIELRDSGPMVQAHIAAKGYAKATIDHIKPKRYGGSDLLVNLRLACAPCNTGRHKTVDKTNYTHHWPGGLSTEEVIDRLAKRDGRKCRHCRNTQQLTVDHKRPLANGGTNNWENLRLLCWNCNKDLGNFHNYKQAAIAPAGPEEEAKP